MFIGVNVRRLREEAKWSKEELAVAAGLSSVRVIEIDGRARLGSLELIAKALSKRLGRDVPIAELLAEPPPEVLEAHRAATAAQKRKSKRRKAS